MATMMGIAGANAEAADYKQNPFTLAYEGAINLTNRLRVGGRRKFARRQFY